MTPKKARVQSAALCLRSIPGVRLLYRFWYWLGIRVFIRFAKKTDRRLGKGILRSIYLRRGGGREELVPAASDLDFFLLLHTVSAEREMEFLKLFWEKYHQWRALFPFLGEVLMGDENELHNWFETPTVRSFEAITSWKHLYGEKIAIPSQPFPDLRDIFSEALKCYWSLLQPVLKLRTENFRQNMRSYEPSAVHLRNATKAAFDLFRLHYSLQHPDPKIWAANRTSLITLLPTSIYGDLNSFRNILSLQDPLFTQDPFSLYANLIHKACLFLDEMATRLEKREDESITNDWRIVYHAKSLKKDPYSLSVRELFAERMLLRHQSSLHRAVLSEMTAHMYFPMKNVPSLEEMQEILADLRDVSFSFDRFSVAMPLTERTFSEMERTSMLDTPFHSFYAHQEILFQEGQLENRTYTVPTPQIPVSMLQKTFSELSFSLRLQPQELEFLLEKMVTLVLAMRLASDHKNISTDFESTLREFGEKYPLRVGHLKEKVAPYMPALSEEELSFWASIETKVQEYGQTSPSRAEYLLSQLRSLKEKNLSLPQSKTLATDLWINLTPFLRMEMNAMKDRYFKHKPPLKI